jgi:hypothetical protein
MPVVRRPHPSRMALLSVAKGWRHGRADIFVQGSSAVVIRLRFWRRVGVATRRVADAALSVSRYDLANYVY